VRNFIRFNRTALILTNGAELCILASEWITRVTEYTAFQYISNKMQRYTVYLYLETALHVSGGTSTHHQELIQLYLQHLVFVTPLLLPAAIAAV
jgi:hypothetical protein